MTLHMETMATIFKLVFDYFSLGPFLGYGLAFCSEHQSLINFRFVQLRTLS